MHADHTLLNGAHVENVHPFPRDQQGDHDGFTMTSPHDAEAENLVGGVIMHDASAYLACAQVINRDDIYQRAIRLIWDVVGGMVAEGKPLHPVTVRAEIEKLGRLREVDGGNLINRLGADYINAGMAPHFADQIRDKARIRRHQEHATAALAAIHAGTADPDTLDALAAKHREQEDRRTTTGQGPSHLTSALLDWGPFFATDFGAVELLLGKLLAPGQQMTLVGDGKAGKSLLAQEWMWRMATGQSFLGDRPRTAVPVLYVDAENGHQDIQDRFASYGGGPGRMGMLSYASFPPIRPLDTAGGGQDLLAMVKDCEAQLVCLDTVSRFISGPENDADTWLSLYRHTLLPLKRAGIASVRLDHMGKDGERGARGSSAKTQDVDHVWELRVQGGGNLLLRRTHTRTGIGPDVFHLIRQARKEGDRYLPGQTRHVIAAYEHMEQNIPGSDEHIIMRLAAAGVPLDAGNRVVKAKLAELQIPAGSDKIARVVKIRQNQANADTAQRSPERSPDPFQETFPGNVPRNGSRDGKDAGQTFPGNTAGTPGTPPVPPSPQPKVGDGEGTPEPEATTDPHCTVCDKPLNTDWAARGYDTHIGCDPATGSHPDTTA
ncbi:AAA family ATPase [Streptomyces lunaelactis]|uniref:AAA family ATPase n=1 Tax=Streptomyces lunaelactis TaxID=1535768 RepID=UPI001585B7D0|nr:AAA family ATPase [Streptomyces lunaelactis]NUK07493.1 AAA family ATPase [Streptomyces lunaelactis]